MDEIDAYDVAPGHLMTVVSPVFYSGGGQYGRRYQTAPSRYTCSCGAVREADTTLAQAHTDEVRV